MGLDIGALWGQLEDSVGQAWDDVVATGVPALQATVEKEAIKWLTEQNKATQATLDSNVQKILEKPSDSSSFGTALSNTLQNSVIKQYGMEIAVGLVVVMVSGYFIFRKQFLMKTKNYKGWIFEFSKPTIGFFSSGRAGKVKRKIWVYNPESPSLYGKWCSTEKEAKSFVDSEQKG